MDSNEVNDFYDKLNIAIIGGIMLLFGTAGAGYTLFKAWQEFTWGDDAFIGYLMMAIGLSIIAGSGLRKVLTMKNRKNSWPRES